MLGIAREEQSIPEQTPLTIAKVGLPQVRLILGHFGNLIQQEEAPAL